MIQPRKGRQRAPTFPPAPGEVLMPLSARAASGHGVGTEVLTPVIFPLIATKGVGTSCSTLGRERSLCNLMCLLKPHAKGLKVDCSHWLDLLK